MDCLVREKRTTQIPASQESGVSPTSETFLDFFAGSGLVCEGMKGYFTSVWANDVSPKKADVFRLNHPRSLFHLSPIEEVAGSELPFASLSWGSFPCQDLSLAGNMKGLEGERSGLVWQWMRVMDEMRQRPTVVVAENVVGLVSTRKGVHYKAIHTSLVKRGYKVGAVILDAAQWVPQSRKRIFIIAVHQNVRTDCLETNGPAWCHPTQLVEISKELPSWVWWKLPKPPVRKLVISDIVDPAAPVDGIDRHRHLLEMIPSNHLKKVREHEGDAVFPGYRRIRNGKQVLELRFDGLAGCLRTPEGGSSRQILVIKRNGCLSTRLLTIREAAALMGVRRDYLFPGSYNDAYKALGDAVVVPVVKHLAASLLFPLVKTAKG